MFKRYKLPLIILGIIGVLIAFKLILSDGLNSNENMRTGGATAIATTTPFPIYISQPITKASSNRGFVIYENQKYDFQIEVPKGSNLVQEDYDTGGSGSSVYTRIQNYGEKETRGLDKGEYYLEISVTDLTKTTGEDYPCSERFINPIKTTVNGIATYRGKVSRGGESAYIVEGLCVEKGSYRYAVTASEDLAMFSKRIIDSFRFVR